MFSTQEIREKLRFPRYHTSGNRAAGSTQPAREKYQLNPVVHWTVVCMEYFHQFRESLFVKPSEGKRAYATRVVFPGPAAALAATPFFINEKGAGCWLSTEDPEILAKGKVMRSERYALHLPSIDQHGQPLPNAVIKGFLNEARRIGLVRRNRATGYWTLSNTGVLQQEAIWILYAATEVPADQLRQLARRVLEEGDQDAVAMEIKGWVEVLSRSG